MTRSLLRFWEGRGEGRGGAWGRLLQVVVRSSTQFWPAAPQRLSSLPFSFPSLPPARSLAQPLSALPGQPQWPASQTCQTFQRLRACRPCVHLSTVSRRPKKGFRHLPLPPSLSLSTVFQVSPRQVPQVPQVLRVVPLRRRVIVRDTPSICFRPRLFVQHPSSDHPEMRRARNDSVPPKTQHR